MISPVLSIIVSATATATQFYLNKSHDLQSHPLLRMEFFNLTSKTHMLQHTTMLARCLSPRMVWCFCGEDMQQKVQTLAQASIKGNTATSAVRKMIRHYRVALHLRFLDHSSKPECFFDDGLAAEDDPDSAAAARDDGDDSDDEPGSEVQYGDDHDESGTDSEFSSGQSCHDG